MSESEKPMPSEPGGPGPGPAGSDANRRRRGRRGGRGRRRPAGAPGEARETPPPTGETSSASPEFIAPAGDLPSESAPPPPAPPAALRPAIEPRPLLERVQRLTERAGRVQTEHHSSAIHQAIDEVMEIVEALKRAVDQMEEVLELVEVAERQKLADEREIESLRRALRQIHDRPRDSRDERDPGESRGPRQHRDPRGIAPRGKRDFREPRPQPQEKFEAAAPAGPVTPPADPPAPETDLPAERPNDESRREY